MRTLKALMITAALGATAIAAVASAAPGDRLNDSSFIRAARCAALANAASLGEAKNAAQIKVFMDNQAVGRDVTVLQNAKTAENRAGREAAKAQGADKEKLVAERDGCVATLS